jgi:uncharacterized membrane protein
VPSFLPRLAVDVLCVLVFVVLGRRNHDEGTAAAGVLETSAPFLIGLAVGWFSGLARSKAVTSLRFGLWAWACTLVVGMVLRRFAFDRGTAFSFVVVATVFLGLFLVGWRLVASRLVPWGRRRAAD